MGLVVSNGRSARLIVARTNSALTALGHKRSSGGWARQVGYGPIAALKKNEVTQLRDGLTPLSLGADTTGEPEASFLRG
jgi:hypothetical protein